MTETRRAVLTLTAILGFAANTARGADTALVPAGSVWRFLDNGSNQGTAWRAIAFDDSAWASGSAQLGYGDGDEKTVVSYGPDAGHKYVTTYFRRSFSLTAPSALTSLTLRLLRDDGAVVYLNGAEAYRSNMPSGTISYTTLASTALGSPAESTFVQAALSPSLLVSGTNVLAVEVHQANGTSSDVSFDLELSGSDSISVTRGPYLQVATPTSVLVRWRTSAPADSRVSYGTSPSVLTTNVDGNTSTTEHEVALTSLSPATRYYYAVGSTSQTLSSGSDFLFQTPPLKGTDQPVRIWAIGDSGTADANARAVRSAYESFAGSRYTDVWLMLGDNAYQSGTDAEYQNAVFATYPKQLRQTALWPTIGNHDTAQSANPVSTLPYYQIFTLPKNGEAGGLASGTEDYYSFDYANVHFVCLDSMTSDRSPGSPMLTWLESDLASTAQDWIIAFWHHPPYSKGSHNSDTEAELRDMRQNVLPILESYGVDLVLTGHSHSYERSFLLDGHYGTSDTLTSAMIKDAGSGHVDGTGAYKKPTVGPAPNEGVVYVVAGSSGKTVTGSLNHPAMYISLAKLGSMVLDVDGNRLDAKFLRETGAVDDYFTVLKGVTPTPPTTLVPRGSPWKYLDNGSNQGTAWQASAFDDTPWKSGPAQLGYGDGDEKTLVSYGPNSSSKYITTYFRRSFGVADATAVKGVTLRLLRDDGAVVYLNGSEVLRSNMPSGSLSYTTLASAALRAPAESTVVQATLSPAPLVTGTNVLAVEIHQANGTSSDISFDLELIASY